MLSFDVGSLEAARRFLNHVKLCSLAESLGGVETLISLPAMMTHASMPKEVQDRVGITEASCAFPSASKTSKTSSPTSTRRSLRVAAIDSF